MTTIHEVVRWSGFGMGDPEWFLSKNMENGTIREFSLEEVKYVILLNKPSISLDENKTYFVYYSYFPHPGFEVELTWDGKTVVPVVTSPSTGKAVLAASMHCVIVFTLD